MRVNGQRLNKEGKISLVITHNKNVFGDGAREAVPGLGTFESKLGFTGTVCTVPILCVVCAQ